MKKLSILLTLALTFTITSLTAQNGFSAKAGLNIVSVSIDLGSAFGGSVSNSETGFYIGGAYNFEVNEKFKVEPGLLFSLVNQANAVYVPVMGQYYFSEDFYAQAGPQINYLLEDVDDGAMGIDLAIGGGYNITDTWFVEARYGFEVFRGGDFGEFTSINTLSIGGGYRF